LETTIDIHRDIGKHHRDPLVDFKTRRLRQGAGANETDGAAMLAELRFGHLEWPLVAPVSFGHLGMDYPLVMSK